MFIVPKKKRAKTPKRRTFYSFPTVSANGRTTALRLQGRGGFAIC